MRLALSLSILASVVCLMACGGVGNKREAAREDDTPARATDDASASTTTNTPRTSLPTIGETAVLDKVAVKLAKVEIRKVQIKSFGDSESKEAHLVITVIVTNRSKDKKLDFRGFGGDFLSYDCTLRDEKDNSYKSIHFGLGSRVVGQVSGGESIYPDQSISDLVVFEVPVKAAKQLRLELQGKPLHLDGTFKFIVPTDKITTE